MKPPVSRNLTIVSVFTCAIFIASLLLFVVQPMVGKMLLPLLGGAPAVWNTCMVFYQALLLLGYGYAHLIARWPAKLQRGLHLMLVGGAFFALPIFVEADAAPPPSEPTGWLLVTLLLAVGLPFFVVSTTSPLLQAWLAQSDHPSGDDPYFLYAASNAGSVLALLAYPLVIERFLPIDTQTNAWRYGYVAFGALTLAAAVLSLRSQAKESIGEKTAEQASASEPTGAAHTSWRRRARWLVLAFVPSSLMLGVTTYVATDIASFPLLWVVPLAIYLVSFIVVFGNRGWRPPPVVGRAMSLVVIALVVALIIGATHPAWLLIGLHLGVFAVACLICHGELAADRPAPSKLTEFYLIMSLGGVLGGALNALVSPVVFDGVWEYPLVMILACMLRPTSDREDQSPDPRWARFVPIGVAATAFASFWVADWLDVEMTQLTVVMVFGPAAIFAYSQVERPTRFGAGALALLFAGMTFSGVYGRTLYQSRNFFGVVRVTQTQENSQHDSHRVLVHGNTIHGRALISDLGDAGDCTPLAYYTRSGPVGSIFEGFREMEVPQEVGIVGLGVGSQGCYAQDNEQWTYYEIDPAVVRVATEPGWFNVLDKSEAASSRFVVGDARVRLEHADPEPVYGLLVIDAFSSDSIPVHLMTVEAVQLYFDRLADDGVLAVHISNRFMDLAPVLGAIAEAEGLSAYQWHDRAVSPRQSRRGKEPSQWVVIARTDADLRPIIDDPDADWQPLSGHPEDIWTDDFSDVISTLR